MYSYVSMVRNIVGSVKIDIKFSLKFLKGGVNIPCEILFENSMSILTLPTMVQMKRIITFYKYLFLGWKRLYVIKLLDETNTCYAF